METLQFLLFLLSTRLVLIPLPLTGMETKTGIRHPFHLNIVGFNSFTPHGDGNKAGFIAQLVHILGVLIPLPLTGMETRT
jgi:hypothetical protein